MCWFTKQNLWHTVFSDQTLWLISPNAGDPKCWETIYGNPKCWQRQFKTTQDMTCTALRSASLQCGRFCCIFLHWNLFVKVGDFLDDQPKGIHVHQNKTHRIMPQRNMHLNYSECSRSCLSIYI